MSGSRRRLEVSFRIFTETRFRRNVFKIFSQPCPRNTFFFYSSTFFFLWEFSKKILGIRSLKILSVIFRKGSHFPEREFLESEDYFLINLKYVKFSERSIIISSKLFPARSRIRITSSFFNFGKHEHEIDKCSWPCNNRIETNWPAFESLCVNYSTVRLFQLKLNDFIVTSAYEPMFFQVFKSLWRFFKCISSGERGRLDFSLCNSSVREAHESLFLSLFFLFSLKTIYDGNDLPLATSIYRLHKPEYRRKEITWNAFRLIKIYSTRFDRFDILIKLFLSPNEQRIFFFPKIFRTRIIFSISNIILYHRFINLDFSIVVKICFNCLTKD